MVYKTYASYKLYKLQWTRGLGVKESANSHIEDKPMDAAEEVKRDNSQSGRKGLLTFPYPMCLFAGLVLYLCHVRSR